MRQLIRFLVACGLTLHFIGIVSAGEIEANALEISSASAVGGEAVQDNDALMALVEEAARRGAPPCNANDFWCRVRLGFALPESDDPETDRQMHHWLRSVHGLEKRIELGRRYLPEILAAVETSGLPTELVLLTLVESGLNPLATSPAQAAGIWQFIPSTGRRFGLEQTWLQDERRTVQQSTRSALAYLGELHNEFHDWPLALAAYNWGEGNVRRAIARTGKAEPGFAELRLPAETRVYVPRLLALKRLIAEPERYGLHLPEIDSEERLVSVRVNAAIDIETASSLAGISATTFRAYNPGLLRLVIPIDADGTANFVLPEDAAAAFELALPDHPGPLSAWVLVRQPRTETLRAIAKRHGVSADTLRRTNGLPPQTVSLVAGSAFLLPRGSARMSDAKEVARDAPTPTGADRAPVKVSYSAPIPARLHVARKGETLRGIARQYRVQVRNLSQWNRLPRGKKRVAPGSRLIVKPYVPARPRYVATDIGDLHPAARIVHPVGRSL